MKHTTTWFILGSILFLLFLFYSNNLKESFLNPFNPGDYPKTQTGPILQDVYKVNPNAHVSSHNYKENIVLYPKSQMASFEHKTNNIHPDEWKTPDNGKCTPADVCGELYLT